MKFPAEKYTLKYELLKYLETISELHWFISFQLIYINLPLTLCTQVYNNTNNESVTLTKLIYSDITRDTILEPRIGSSNKIKRTF